MCTAATAAAAALAATTASAAAPAQPVTLDKDIHIYICCIYVLCTYLIYKGEHGPGVLWANSFPHGASPPLHF